MIARRLIGAFVLAAALVIESGAGSNASSGGTLIANAASASYEDAPGHSVTITSNTVQTTVAAVGALAVSPKEDRANPATESYAAGSPVVRTFTITNASNIPDAYTIAGVTTGAGSVTSVAFLDASGAPLPASIGSTVSPTIAPGGSLRVVVTIATAGVAVGTTFPIALSARTTVATTVNGLQSDTGRVWAVSATPPAIGGPGGVNVPISKLVDEARSEQSQPGAAITYQIRFQNYGAAAALNAVLTDTVPLGIHADPASVRLNGAPAGATLSGQTLRVPVGTLAPGVPMTVTIAATVDPANVLGATYVNVASISADNLPAQSTTPASVLIGKSDIVFDGLSSGGKPVGGATVSLVDPVTLKPIPLPAAGDTINPRNADPFVTGPDGVYAFTIPTPAAGTTLAFDILIHAPGYLDRKIKVLITPDASGVLYTVQLTSLDGQPLARAGSFTLTDQSVKLTDVFSLLGNLPLFSNKPIAVTKTADRGTATPGDRVTYTVGFSSTVPTTLGTTTVVDTLPAGLAYARGTAAVDGSPAEPVVDGRVLRWQFDALAPGTAHTIVYACVVLPGVAAGTNLVNGVTVSGSIPGTLVGSSGAATASVLVRGGLFSDRAVITGRVFADVMNTGHFREGDRGVAGARIYLENGESVSTDAEGRFSFPGVRPGMHILRLDETSLPRDVHVAADRRIDSPRSPVRLLHGILDEGLLQDVQFALEPFR